MVAISRSGTTTEVIELLRALKARGQRTTAIVATEGTTIPQLAKHQVMLLAEVDEQSVVQTRFATTTLALLRASLGEDLTDWCRRPGPSSPRTRSRPSKECSTPNR